MKNFIFIVLYILPSLTCFSSWEDGLDLVLKDEVETVLSNTKTETLSDLLLRFQKLIKERSGEELPIFISPKLASMEIKPWKYDVTNIPVGDALGYLHAWTNREFYLVISDVGVVFMTEEERELLKKNFEKKKESPVNKSGTSRN